MEKGKWLDSLREWLITAAVVIFVLFGWSNKRRVEYVDRVSNDTIYIHDTIRVVEPKVVKEYIVGNDTAFFPVVKDSDFAPDINVASKNEPKHSARLINEVSKSEQEDSIPKSCASYGRVTGELSDSNHFADSNNMVADSVAVVIPITQKMYEDSLYKAWVSGYNARLDSFHLYRKEVYIPMVIETKAKPKVVVSAGVYGGFGVKGADCGVGISVGVPIWWW